MSNLLRFSAIAGAFLALALPADLSSAAVKNAHDFSFETIEGEPMPLSQFKGKVVMVVNTASFCGYTPQYTALESLWKNNRDKGVVVVGVPSNDFGGQEPGSAKEIKEFCESKYDIDFPLTSKAVVKGANAHPFYQWAKEQMGEGNAPRWNFHKYLIGPNGELVAAFDSKVKPDGADVMAAIDKARAAK